MSKFEKMINQTYVTANMTAAAGWRLTLHLNCRISTTCCTTSHTGNAICMSNVMCHVKHRLRHMNWQRATLRDRQATPYHIIVWPTWSAGISVRMNKVLYLFTLPEWWALHKAREFRFAMKCKSAFLIDLMLLQNIFDSMTWIDKIPTSSTHHHVLARFTFVDYITLKVRRSASSISPLAPFSMSLTRLASPKWLREE